MRDETVVSEEITHSSVAKSEESKGLIVLDGAHSTSNDIKPKSDPSGHFLTRCSSSHGRIALPLHIIVVILGRPDPPAPHPIVRMDIKSCKSSGLADFPCKPALRYAGFSRLHRRHETTLRPTPQPIIAVTM